MGDGVCVVLGCMCMGGTCGSGVVSSEDDVIEMSVVRGVRGVGGVCECAWLGERCEDERIVFSFSGGVDGWHWPWSATVWCVVSGFFVNIESPGICILC